MNTEYEVRILEIDSKEIVKRLEKLGAQFQWSAVQKSYVYDFIPKIEGKWIRLRTNGNKTTLAIKNVVSSTIDGTQELEVEVNDFYETNAILKELGFEAKGYQEHRRCQYVLDEVELDIDMWPLIPTYLEIEGKSEQAVYDMVARLGFCDTDIVTDDVWSIYLKYGYQLAEICELKLEEERK